jgi:hypothetical protein
MHILLETPALWIVGFEEEIISPLYLVIFLKAKGVNTLTLLV